MALNNASQSVIAKRREIVSSLLLRKMTQREIVEHLQKEGFKNPDTLEPWSLATINGDTKALKQQWRKEAGQKIEVLQGQLYMELEEVKREAWKKFRLFDVLRAIEQQRDMLGLVAARHMKVDMTVDWRKELEDKGVSAGDLFNSLVAQIAANLAEGD